MINLSPNSQSSPNRSPKFPGHYEMITDMQSILRNLNSINAPFKLYITPRVTRRGGGLKVNVQICSYRLAKPTKPIFFPKVEKSYANWCFSGQKKSVLGLESQNSKISKPKLKPLPSAFRLIQLFCGQQIAILRRWSKRCHEMAQNFKTSYIGQGINFLDIFRAQNDRLVTGYMMGTDIF